MSTWRLMPLRHMPGCMSQSDGMSQPPAIGEDPDLTLTGNRPDPRQNVSSPSATRTRVLLLRRHSGRRTVQTSTDARGQRAKQLKAVALGTIFAGSLPYGRGPTDFSRMAAISSTGSSSPTATCMINS
jgi:hypothetical protein